MGEINLTALNRGYCSDRSQTPIAKDLSGTSVVGQQTFIDVSEGSLWRSPKPTVSSATNPTNCTFSIIEGMLMVTGTSQGAASIDYTLSGGGDYNQATLTLDITPDLGLSVVTLTDVTATGFDEVLEVGDQLSYSTSTTIEAAVVSVNVFGRVVVTGTYTEGDSFNYSINGGSTQVYTFG